MINIGKILKRSWQILWSYKILWIFGLLLSLTSPSSGGGNGGGGNSGYKFNGSDGQIFPQSNNPTLQQLNHWFQQTIVPLFTNPDQHIATFIWIGVGVILFFLVIGLLFALVRYPTETAIIRMVDMYEQTSEKVGFKKGWKLGWNRRAFRIWVIDLIISLPTFVFLALLVGLGFLVFFTVQGTSGASTVASIIASIGCAFIFIFAFVIFMVVLGLLRQFFIRAAAMENTGIGESFRMGWETFKNNWKSAALMWLVMLGIGIGSTIAGVIVFFLLIPAYLVMILPATIVAGIPGLIVYGITSIFTGGPLTWILGILVAVPFFFVVMFLPLGFVHGWYLIYDSSVWTLTYREMKALESVAPEAESPALVE